MIILKADNRTLLQDAKYSYLLTNYASGVSTLSVVNTDGMIAGGYVLVGNIGSESTEIFKLSSVDDDTGALTFEDEEGVAVTTKYSHAESTRVTAIAYNKVRFYYGTTSTYSTATALTGYLDIQPTQWFSTYNDEAHSTGYGWFIFYNTTALLASQPSNPIPYAGFGANTVGTLMDGFFSMLNQKELKLISLEDAFSWLNEGLSFILNSLNLVNSEYTVTSAQTLNVTAGTQEYALPADFSDMVVVWDSESLHTIPFIPIKDVPSYSLSFQGYYYQNVQAYYIRGAYIGLAPTPTEDFTYYYQYKAKTSSLVSYDQTIDLPDNGFFILKDFMLYRACQKLTKPDAASYYKIFNDGVNTLKVTAVKRDANLDTWGQDPHTMI
jgi:hypothetical protein